MHSRATEVAEAGEGARERPARPPLGERLLAGMEDVLAHLRGEKELRVTVLTIPDPPPAFDAARVRAVRERFGMSQRTFSLLLNVSLKTVQSWEQGQRVPGQASARLLQIIDDPGILRTLAPDPAAPEAAPAPQAH